jgi:hypothetical protein
MATMIDDSEINYALISLKTGEVLDSAELVLGARMQDLAAAAPELFRAGNPDDRQALFQRLGSELKSDSFQEIVFVSARSAHVVQRLAQQPELALLAVSTDTRKLGLMLSGVRARLLQLEAHAAARGRSREAES